MEMDFETFEFDAESLFSFNLVIMANDQPDIQVMEFNAEYEIGPYLDKELGSAYVQTIITNRNEETKGMCPYFRICMSGFSSKTSINFKLKAFLNRIGMEGISSHCEKAVVMGLATLHHLESPISVPYLFCTTKIDSIDLALEESLDLACMEVCAESKNPGASSLCDIAGVTLPYFLPWEVQSLILQFSASPTADMIKRERTHLCRSWDALLFTMFRQREPRIPVHIASFFNAATVQQTVADATRPFLVRLVERSMNVFLTTRNS